MNTLSKTFIAVLLSGGAYAAIACAATACSASPITGITEVKTYRNPLIDTSLPDPTVIRAQDGCWYLYATEDIRNTPVYKSDNLVDWSFVGTAFTDETRPKWNPKGNLWAPDINYINGQYVLYYAKSEWGRPVCALLCQIGMGWRVDLRHRGSYGCQAGRPLHRPWLYVYQ